MRVLSVDVGGTHVKVFATGQDSPRQSSSRPTLTAEQMVAVVKSLAAGGQRMHNVVTSTNNLIRRHRKLRTVQ
jgi:hypothetical protein